MNTIQTSNTRLKRPANSWKQEMATICVASLIYLILTWMIKDRYYQLMFTIVPIWALVGVAWNIFSGYSGLLSFGHAAFFGIGAYTVALLMVFFNISPWFGLIATYYPFQPYIGIEFVIIMYTGVLLGGMGSVYGAFLGGVTIGLVQQLSTLVLPHQLQNTAIFVVFLLILLFRPQGLFGKSVDRV